MKRELVGALTYCLCCLLSACGGGGGGSGSAGNGSSGTSDAAPAPPTISYVGAATPADFNDANAGIIADGMFAMTFLALDIAQDIGAPATQPGPFSSIQKSAEGGTLSLKGVLNPDNTGWIQGTFADYVQDGITYNGGEVVEITQALNGNSPQIGRISYYDLHAVGANLNVDYVGTINRQIADPFNKLWTVTGNVLIHDLLANIEWYAQGINITRQNTDAGRELTVISRVSESDFGYVDVTTTSPWVFASNVTSPHHGGPLLGTGKDARTLAISSLTPELGALEYMSVPEAKPDRSALITWIAPAAQQTSTEHIRSVTSAQSEDAAVAPVADAGAAVTMPPGTQRTLDGRFSFQPDGGFVSFSWRLAYRPPGSSAVLSDANATQPTINFDIPGDYVVELTASNGSSQTTDAISIPVRSSGAVGGFAPTPVQLAPDQKVTIGQTYSFTLQQPMNSFDPQPSFNLAYYSPDGQIGSLPVQSDGTYQITPTIAGMYRIVVSELNNGVQLDDQWLAAGMDFRFLPAASIPRSLGSPALNFMAKGDLNGDGLADLVLSTSDTSLAPALEVYHGNAAGGFDPAVIIMDGSGGPVVVGDFNGDGRPDIAVATSNGFDVLLQQADGTLAAPKAYSLGCFIAQDQAILAAGDFNGDGRTDIVIGGCVKVVLFVQGSDGALHQSTAIAIPSSDAGQTAVADLNGDGLSDLAIALGTGSPGNILIIHGDRTAGLGSVQMLSESFSPGGIGIPALAVGDINGDGRADLLFSIDDGLGNLGIHVYLQQENGTLQPGPVISTGHGITTGIYVADLNGDGRADVIVAGGDGPGISVRYQNADGTLAAPLADDRFNDGSVGSPKPIGLFDVDRDGILDVLAINSDQQASKLIIGYGVAPGTENSQTQSVSPMLDFMKRATSPPPYRPGELIR
jgi:hypothetical protein